MDYTKLNKRRDEEEVEYTRTDAFIEKSCTYWHKKAKEAEGEVGYYIMSCIEDFKKAMEE